MIGFGKNFPWKALLFFLLSGGALLAQSSSADLQQRYYRQGQQALAQQHYAEAEQAFEKLRALDPGIAQVHAQLGVLYFQEKKFNLAAESLRHALKLNPSLPGLHTLLALSLAELGHYHQALPGLESGFRRGGTPPPVRRMCGLELERAYTELQQDGQAVAVALRMNQLYPNDPEVLYHTGRIFGNFAFLSMQKLAAVAPDSLWRHEAAAQAFESEGSWDQAIREYHAVLAINPRQPDVHYWLGRTLLARSRQSSAPADLAEALRQFAAELQLDPGQANAAYEIAEINRNGGHLDVARTFFERALNDYPDFREAQLGLAAVLLAQRKPGLAVPHLQKAIALNREDEVSWYRLAQAYRALGDTAGQRKAFAEFQRLKSQQPTGQEATRQMFSPTAVTRQKLDPAAAQ